MLAACFLSGHAAFAQDLAITHATVIDGTGAVIQDGSVIVQGGRIVSIAEGVASTSGTVIDVGGMTVMPGFIDTHRHDLFATPLRELQNDADVARALKHEAPAQLLTLLREGFTTIMFPGGHSLATIHAIRSSLARAELMGPRVLFAGPSITAPGDHPVGGPVCRGRPFCAEYLAVQTEDPGVALSAVREQAAARVDAIKVVVDRMNVPQVTLDERVLAAVIAESHSLDLPVMVHAETTADMIRAVELGADRLVHTPPKGLVSDGSGASVLKAAGVPISTTISFWSQQFADAMGFDYQRAPELQVLLRNVRHLWDEGVTVAFGTDSPPNIRPMVEVEELSKVLTAGEIVTAITKNAAVYLGLSNDIGTLEPGKIADIVVVDGDPLANISNLANVRIVIQGGRIVVDMR